MISVSFSDYLTEVFDSVLKWKWTDKGEFDGWVAKITPDKGKWIEVTISENPRRKGMWVIVFYADGGFLDPTGDQNSFKIMSTVIKITADFLKLNGENVKVIKFEANKIDEKKATGKESRQKLYDSLVKRFASKAGFQATIKTAGNERRYTLTRK